MRTLTALALLLVTTGATADAGGAVRLEPLTPAEAARPDGKRVLFNLKADSELVVGPRLIRYRCETPRGTPATAWLRPGTVRPGESAVVEADLSVIHHPARVFRGVRLQPLTEYRLQDAAWKA